MARKRDNCPYCGQPANEHFFVEGHPDPTDEKYWECEKCHAKRADRPDRWSARREGLVPMIAGNHDD